uniref:Cnd1 domain-containing protein n=1 Tax=Globodera pallida TaxID=36090 RepID=A0A183BS60_GLOPA
MNEMEEESMANFEELVANLLHKTSAVTLKAMKDVELHVSSGLHIPELLQSAELLVQSMQRETNGRLAYVGATPVHLINFLLCRCEEERVNLKKAAICTLQTLFLRLRDPDIVEACVKQLARKCRDVSVAVRKQAALTLTRFLQGTPHFEQVHEAWLHSVMYQIVDREPSVQTHCAKLVSEVFIEPIMKNTEGNAAICWRMLALVEEEADLRRLLLRSLIFLSKERLLPPRLIALVLNRCSANPEQAYPCWMLLSELSTFLDVSPNEAVSFWSDYLSLIHPNRLIGYMADLIANQTKNLSFQQRRFLKENVSGALRRFKIHPTYISSVYHMFARIVNGVDPDAPGHAELRKFNQQWFGQCLQGLDSLIYANALPETDEDDANSSSQGSAAELSGSQSENCEKIIRLITSVGECLQYTPALINKQIFKLLQVIIASDVLKRVYQTHNEKADRCENLLASPPSLNTSFRTELPVCGPGGSQSNAASEAGGVVNDGLHNQFHMRIKKRIFRGELMSREVRASSVLTIGKLCLLDEQLAKKCIPVFVRQLRENQDHFVRNNIVVVICDLCIRYTSQVDRYSSILASCLWDSSILIRRQTLLLLTNLIKEQYLKWEGPIIYRFVTTLLDAEQCIQEYANFCLTDILLPQFRERMFFHHFLECMFNFNGVRHASWIFKDSDVSELNEEAEKRCSLEGRESFNSRMRLYKYMLNTFEDQQRVYILEKIGLEIFVPIVEEGMKLTDGKVRNLLFDAFKVMGTEEIKLKMQLGKMDVDYEGDDEDPPELVKTAAKKLIATTFRKSIAETVMPHLFLLKSFLAEKRNPLAKSCYSVILDLCREHEEQLDDFLASDPQLRAEIKCDMRRLSNNNKRR